MKRLAVIIIILAIVCVSGKSAFLSNAGGLIRALPELSEEGYGKIVLLRPNIKTRGFREDDYNVYINYFIVDRIRKGYYEEYHLPPGAYRIYAGNDIVSKTVDVEVAAGETICLETRMKLHGDDYPTIDLHQISGGQAQYQMRKMKKGKVDYSTGSHPALPVS